MRPLIDGDIFCWEISSAANVGWNGETPKEEWEVPPWEYVKGLVDTRLLQLCSEAGGDEDPLIFLSGENNFRYNIYPEYKANRVTEKPFHHKNIKVHFQGMYDTKVIEGIEADDALSIEQCKALDRCEETIICSRDKDLRMVPGWHYSWEIGNQPSWGPCYVCDPGYITLIRKSKSAKVEGTGLMWFYAQMLMGDKATDNIPGLPKVGPVKAYKILEGAYDADEALERVYEQYHCHYGNKAEEKLQLMGQLLWMIRETNEQGPVMWQI